MGALVLKKFDIKSDATGKNDCIHVVGRQSGLIAFFMSLAKIDPTTEIKCNDERIEVTKSSFFGQQSICMPIAAVTGIIGGYTKPKSLLFGMLPVMFVGFSLAQPMRSSVPILVAVVLCIVMFVMYMLKKEMSLFAQNGGDTLWGLTFKRSIIEGVDVDSQKVNTAVGLMNSRVIQLHSK